METEYQMENPNQIGEAPTKRSSLLYPLEIDGRSPRRIDTNWRLQAEAKQKEVPSKRIQNF